MHATAFVAHPEQYAVTGLVVLHGGEAQLKEACRHALQRIVFGGSGGGGEGEHEEEGDEAESLGLTRFGGKDTEWKAVRDELRTVSMFGDRRLVIVDDADDFITRHRDALETYAAQPVSHATLVLNVKTWRKNTRLAKKVADAGLELDCSELAGAPLLAWLVEQARGAHAKQLTRDAAALLVQLAGSGLTLLAQELAKLAAYAGDREKIAVDDVRALVGGWSAETTWRMTDAVRDGRTDVVLQSLEKLLVAGEAPQRILGGVNFVFRKYARATELSRTGLALRAALQQAGVFPRDVEAGERYLRRIGRPRAERIYVLLQDADAGLKGGSRMPERMQLERLLLGLAGALPAARSVS